MTKIMTAMKMTIPILTVVSGEADDDDTTNPPVDDDCKISQFLNPNPRLLLFTSPFPCDHPTLYSLQRHELRVLAHHTRATVLDGLVGDGELTQVVANHLLTNMKPEQFTPLIS